MPAINYLLIISAVFLGIGMVMFIRAASLPNKIRKAEEFLQNGELNKANDIIRKILERNKDYAPARYLRAQILIKQGQYLMAVSELNSILLLPDHKKFINEVEIHYHLAFLYNETKNYQKEIDEYKIILTFNPDDIKANYRLGHALFKQKDYKRVKELLLRAYILDPTLKDCIMPIGVSCFHLADYDKAEEFLSLELKNPGDHTEAQFYLGQILKMKRDFETAVKMLESAKTNRKFFVRSLYLLGEIFFEKGDNETAIEYLEEGLQNLQERTEESQEYRYLLAECYQSENKIKEAIYHWEKIYTENPGYRSTKIKLDSYKEIMTNSNLTTLFASSLEELQPVIVEMISSLNYHIQSKEKLSQNEFLYKAYNIKRTNDPPLLIYFNRTTREITEGQIIEFYKKINEEKCKSGIYITTSRYSLRAKSSATSKMIELYGSEFVVKIMEKILARKKASRS
jgi:tetratricopeptide (TPR) repeat protein